MKKKEIKKEEWKDIIGYEGLYLVSNLGKIARVTKKGLRYKKPYPISTGHLQVKLHEEGLCKNFLLSRLVAQAFIPNPENKERVTYKDGDKLNCEADNLLWIDMDEFNYIYHTNKDAKEILAAKQTVAKLGKERENTITTNTEDNTSALKDYIVNALYILNLKKVVSKDITNYKYKKGKVLNNSDVPGEFEELFDKVISSLEELNVFLTEQY